MQDRPFFYYYPSIVAFLLYSLIYWNVFKKDSRKQNCLSGIDIEKQVNLFGLITSCFSSIIPEKRYIRITALFGNCTEKMIILSNISYGFENNRRFINGNRIDFGYNGSNIKEIDLYYDHLLRYESLLINFSLTNHPKCKNVSLCTEYSSYSSTILFSFVAFAFFIIDTFALYDYLTNNREKIEIMTILLAIIKELTMFPTKLILLHYPSKGLLYVDMFFNSVMISYSCYFMLITLFRIGKTRHQTSFCFWCILIVVYSISVLIFSFKYQKSLIRIQSFLPNLSFSSPSIIIFIPFYLFLLLCPILRYILNSKSLFKRIQPVFTFNSILAFLLTISFKSPSNEYVKWIMPHFLSSALVIGYFYFFSFDDDNHTVKTLHQ